MMFRNRVKIFIIIFLSIIEFTSFFLMIKAYNNRDLEETNEEHVVDKEKYGLYIENDEGKYVEYTDSTLFPSNLKYTFNETKSSCVDTLNKEVDNAILYNDNKITVTSNKTVFCYLYFDLDKEFPKTFTFYIGGNSNPTYTKNTNTTGYINWSDTDIENYCISTTSTSSSCTWKDISNQTITENITLASGDGTKTMYAYLKDYAGNETRVSDTIILDTTAPNISSVTKTTDVETSIGISVSASDDNGISKYYYSISNGSYSESTSSTHTFSGLTAGTTYSISVYVEDSAGNISEVTTKSFKTYESKAVGKYLLSHPTTGLNTTMQGGLYRYQGTSANNYVCFGTTVKSTCTGDTGTYMYRIIGINSSYQPKLIKMTPITSTTTNSVWYSSLSNIAWPSSKLYSTLNSYVSGLSTTWSNKMATTTWTYGDVTDLNVSASNMRTTEVGFSTTTSSKASLMYIHDYYYALNGGNNCSIDGKYETCLTSWIHLSKNGYASTDEWTMSRKGRTGSSYYAHQISSGGNVSSPLVTDSASLRPVFYLTTSVQITSGTGTKSDPFIIS